MFNIMLLNTSLSNLLLQMIRKAYLCILDPVNVTITKKPASIVNQGETVTLRCRTTGGNPLIADRFFWRKCNRLAIV